jgi:hypothetical protein
VGCNGRRTIGIDCRQPLPEDGDMRKTVSLDEDVDRVIRQQMKESGDSFKVVVDRLLRLGLRERGYQVELPKPSDRRRKK